MITQGKWKVKGYESLNSGVFRVVSGDQIICIIQFIRGLSLSDKGVQQEKDNARLIAAAPDLLEACKDREQALWDSIAAITTCKPGEKSHQLSPSDQEEYLKLDSEWNKLVKLIAKAEKY